MISKRNDDTGFSLQNMMITERSFNREDEIDSLLLIRPSSMMNEHQYQCSDPATAVSSLSLSLPSLPSLPSSSYLLVIISFDFGEYLHGLQIFSHL